jgi:hypothetical protein
MTAGTLNFYNSFTARLGIDISLESDELKIALLTSGYVPNADHATFADLTNELSGSGYAEQILTGQSYTQASGIATFDADDPVFQASGGNWTAKYWAMFDNTLADKPLICYGLIDATGINVTVTDGNQLIIFPNVAGFFIQEYTNG